MRRYLKEQLIQDVGEKMVFLSGPRQVGKTTLSMQILEELSPAEKVYLNWDRPEHRKVIRDLDWSRLSKVVVLDEVHKYGRWKSLLKGFYDTEGATQKPLVTGSGRLDFYRKGGDSLAGRYFRLRLHPLSLGELARNGKPPERDLAENPDAWGEQAAEKDTLSALLRLGGFPEPFLAGSDTRARRWRLLRQEQVLKQDLRDLALVRDVSLLEQLVDMLKERVTSPLSIQALSEDLQVDHKTISRWIDILERLQLVFRVPPYAGTLTRSIRKAYKVYFWDWAEIPPGGARLENLVASHLLKFCHWLEDCQGHRAELGFVRDREKREVDFLLQLDHKPWILIEAKSKGTSLEKSLMYFKERLDVRHALQLSGDEQSRKHIVPASRLLATLP